MLFYPFAFVGTLVSMVIYGEGSSFTAEGNIVCVIISLVLLSIVFLRLYWPNKVFKTWWSPPFCLLLIWSQYFLWSNKIHQ
jgi:hypothetical protein